MSNDRKPLPNPEDELLGIHRLTPEEDAEATREADDKRKVREMFLTDLMRNELFREWLMEQLLGFRTFDTPFGVSPTGFPDREATQFHLGMKAAGWHLWTLFDDIAPELTSMMRREAMKPKTAKKKPGG